MYALQLEHFLPLVKKVIDQTERRVLRGEFCARRRRSSSASSSRTPTSSVKDRTRHLLRPQGHDLDGSQWDGSRPLKLDREWQPG